jgi:outer membrane receptor protein involved in Fe transport
MRPSQRLCRIALTIILAGTLLGFSTTVVRAQGATGKIQGTVIDPTGEPLPGAQVFVLGTGFAAVTDERGYYFFNHVSAGTYNMRAQFIGYQPAEVQNARVLADQTLTVNFGLSGAVALEAIVVTAAESPIVPRDQVTSKSITSGDIVTDLPVDEPRDVVNLQPGVVETGDADGVSIRGGRPGEAVVYVDGVPVRRLRYGSARLDIGPNALEEVSVTTGALGAEYGDAQSGVISLVTRSGGPRFQGTLLYETDEVFNDAVSVGFNRFEGSLSGPIIGSLTFFVSGTVTGQNSAFAGAGWENVPTYVLGGLDTTVTIADEAGDSIPVDIPLYVQYSGECDPAQNLGVQCQGRRLPWSWRTRARANAKLTYTYGSGSRVSLSGLWDSDQERDYPGEVIFNPAAYVGTRSEAQVYILNWVQQVFRNPESELAFDLNLSYQRDREVYGALDAAWEHEHREPALGIEFSRMKFLNDFNRFSSDDPSDPRSVQTLLTQEDWDQLVDNVRSGIGTRVPYEGRHDLDLRQPYRNNPFGMADWFPTVGYRDWGGARINEDDRWLGRLNVDWQFDRYNRLKFGAEGQVGRLNTANTPLTWTDGTNVYSESPVRWAAYVQDRLDLGDVVLELGLRWDYFDTRSIFPVTVRTFDHPVYDPDVPIEQFTCSGNECDPRQHIWRESDAQSAWSPRLRVSFPVTDRTNFRFSYGHQVQTPAMLNVYYYKNEAFRLNGGQVTFGRTVLFEFGLRHAFTRDLVLDAAAFNKEKISDFASRVFEVLDPLTDGPAYPNGLTNADFGNVRGFDVQLLYRAGNWFNGQAAYTFQNARGTGSDPYSRWYQAEFSQVTGELTQPPEALLRTDHDRRHNITGSLAFNWPGDFQRGTWHGEVLRNAGLFLRFQFLSGLPFTREINTGVGARTFGGSGGWDRNRAIDDQLNASSLPWQNYIDLRITKGIRLGPTDWTLYADFRNLFNFRNVIGVFEETGNPRNDKFREKIIGEDLARLREAAGPSRFLSINKGSRQLEAIDVSNCGNPEIAWAGAGGAADCVMVQRTEERFGDGDQIYDEEEQLAAMYAWYEMWDGEQYFLGDPRHIRLGVEISF